MKTKSFILGIALVGATASSYAQVGVGTDTPESTLDVRATNHLGAVTGTDGVLAPRVNDLTTAGTVNGQLVYLIADVASFTKGFHYWNGSAWTPISEGDGDAWGVTGEDQTSEIKRTGNVRIGATPPWGSTSRLEVYADDTNDNGVKIEKISNNGAGAPDYALNIATTQNNPQGSIHGIRNFLKSDATIALQTSELTGFYNEVSGASDARFVRGINNVVSNNGIGDYHYGIINTLSGTGSGIGQKYATLNTISGGGGTHYGTRNNLISSSGTNHYGVYNYLTGSGSGNKYGVYNDIPSSTGGTHYGIYSDVQKAGSWSGYFVGEFRNSTINSNAGNISTDKIVVADAEGDFKTVDASALVGGADVRMVGTNNHITQDAGVGGTGTSAGSGSGNIALGDGSGNVLSTGSNNVLLGYGAGPSINTGGSNIGIGANSLQALESGNNNIALGNGSLVTTSGNSNIGIGANTLADNDASNNTIVGTNAFTLNSDGGNNIVLGYGSADNLSTGSNNLIIGYDVDAPIATGSNQLNIGNLIYGTGIDGTGTTVSSGNVGIGKSAPAEKLDVTGSLANQIQLTSGNYTGVYSGKNTLGGGYESTTMYNMPNATVGAGDQIKYVTVQDNRVAMGVVDDVTGTTIPRTEAIFTTQQELLHQQVYNTISATEAAVAQFQLQDDVAGLTHWSSELTDSALSTNYKTTIEFSADSPIRFYYNNGSTFSYYDFPRTDGTAGQVLTTDGSGTLSWGAGAGATSWSLTGNSGTTAGTNFIGTTDSEELMFKVNNQIAGYIGASAGPSDGNVYFGYNPTATLNGTWNIGIGERALSTTSVPSSSNIAIGALALQNTAGGTKNVAIGGSAGVNLAVGSSASDNVLLGDSAGSTLTLGNRNIIVGQNIQPANTTGSNQLNIGNIVFGTGVSGEGDPNTATNVQGNIGIGVTAPTSRLEVAGSMTNETAFDAGASTTVDFSQSNLAYTTASPGAFTLNNIEDGGAYTLAVQGTTAGTSTFSATGFTFKSANNGVTIGGAETLYTFVVMGTTVYYHMISNVN
ncbi:MAG: hypothetical protein H6604_03620 [Flavobacteriales bacterium]|nr:hypothetical protein [Flavobacteriales bacterium]